LKFHLANYPEKTTDLSQKKKLSKSSKIFLPMARRGRCGRDRMVIGFTTTYAIIAYHHKSCEFLLNYTYNLYIYKSTGGINGHDRMVVEFTTRDLWNLKYSYTYTYDYSLL
jgi:hypothetical protein